MMYTSFPLTDSLISAFVSTINQHYNEELTHLSGQASQLIHRGISVLVLSFHVDNERKQNLWTNMYYSLNKNQVNGVPIII